MYILLQIPILWNSWDHRIINFCESILWYNLITQFESKLTKSTDKTNSVEAVKRLYVMFCFRGWSEIATFHWVRLAGFSRLKSRLQTRSIRTGISTRSMGRSASSGGRAGRSSGRLYGLDTTSWLYRIQVFKFYILLKPSIKW